MRSCKGDDGTLAHMRLGSADTLHTEMSLGLPSSVHLNLQAACATAAVKPPGCYYAFRRCAATDGTVRYDE